MQSGAYQAGALNGQVWDSRLKEGKVDTNKVVLLRRTALCRLPLDCPGQLDQRFGAGFTSKLQQSLFNMSLSQPRQNHPRAVCSRAVHSGQGC